jgi:hypothetical protein
MGVGMFLVYDNLHWVGDRAQNHRAPSKRVRYLDALDIFVDIPPTLEVLDSVTEPCIDVH